MNGQVIQSDDEEENGHWTLAFHFQFPKLQFQCNLTVAIAEKL